MTFDVLAFLKSTGQLPSTSAASAEPLSGGYWNTVYRVVDTKQSVDWVVKVFSAESPLSIFPIRPESEFASLQLLAPHNITPAPVAFFPKSDNQPAVLAYQFYHGSLWADDIEAVAEKLGQLHALPVDNGPAFRQLNTSADALLAQGDYFLDRLPVDPLAQQLRQLRPPVKQLPQPTRRHLVHTDIGAGNMVMGANGLRLIDWQCPGYGEPAEDLCSFFSPAMHLIFERSPFTSAEWQRFLDAYPHQDVLDRLPIVAPYYHYRMACYCAMRRHTLRAESPRGADIYVASTKLMIELLHQLQ